MSAGCRATPTRSAAYHFTYMIPQANEEVLQRYNEKRVPFKAILPIGEMVPRCVTCLCWSWNGPSGCPLALPSRVAAVDACRGARLRRACAGNAPVMIHRSLLEQIVEDWYDISLRMKNDPDANRAFGWILEMVRAAAAAAAPALAGS